MNNISGMFYGINSLLPISDFSKFNTMNVTKMSYLFYNCSKLIKLPDISIIKTDNVTDMSYMFYNCSSLTNLPDISKFNTKNTIDMSYMFCKCTSLIKLPDITIWNMENIVDISYMFCDCKLIVSIPDISKWKVNKDNVRNTNYLFKNCRLIKEIPKISKWKLDNNFLSNNIIEGCDSLEINIEEQETLDIKLSNNFKCVIDNSIAKFLIQVWLLMQICYAVNTLYFAFYRLFISTNLFKKALSFKNPIEYFKLKNRINISYMANYYNISNLTIINETYGSAENFINNMLIFNSINDSIRFEYVERNFKMFSIISLILYIFDYILFFSLSVDKHFKIISLSYKLFLLIIISVLFMISIN